MKINKISLLAAIAACCLAAGAQNTTSPYSRIGYGLLNDNASGIQRSMGGVGYAMQDPRAINAMNPASYSQVDSLTFLWDMGIDLTNLWSKEGTKSGYSFGGGLDYITAQFRMLDHLGGSFGLLPYSSVGYSFGSTLDDQSDYRTGSGNISQLYLGVGWEPLKGLSVGVNGGYLFGTTVNSTSLVKSSTAVFQRTVEVRDWHATAGVQYAFDATPRDRVVVGATYAPQKSLHGHTWGLVYDSQDSDPDTVGYTSLKGKFETPHTVGAGLSWRHNNRLLVEVDGTYQPWADVKYSPLTGFEAADMKFNNRWKVAAGLQYSPNRRGSYMGAMAYRLGAYFNHDYQNVNGNNVRDYGVSLGVGLPVTGFKTTVNLGVEWKHRYTDPVALVKEDYLNITVSVNFNETAFFKNKIR